MLVAPRMAYRWGNSKHRLLQWEIRRQRNHNSHSSIASLKLHLIVHIFSQLYHTAKAFVTLHSLAQAPATSEISGTNCDLEPTLNLNVINSELSYLDRESGRSRAYDIRVTTTRFREGKRKSHGSTIAADGRDP